MATTIRSSHLYQMIQQQQSPDIPATGTPKKRNLSVQTTAAAGAVTMCTTSTSSAAAQAALEAVEATSSSNKTGRLPTLGGGFVSLQGSLVDSPEARGNIVDAAEEFKRTCGKMTELQKLLRLQRAAGQEYINCSRQISKFLPTMIPAEDRDAKKLVDDAVTILNFIEEERETLVQAVDMYLGSPMQNFLESDFKLVKSSYKEFLKTTDSVEATAAKLSQVKKNKARTLEEQEVIESKIRHKEATLNLATAINASKRKLRLQLLEGIQGYVQLHQMFLRAAAATFEDQESELHNLVSCVSDIRDAVKLEDEGDQMLHETLVKKDLIQFPAVKQDSHEIEGYLFKCTTRSLVTSWVRTYCRIQGGRFYYYPPKVRQPLFVEIMLTTVRLRDELERQYCFEIISPTETIILQAETPEIRDAWISIINSSRMSLLVKTDLTTAPPKLALLRELYPANNRCADCGSLNPEWASLNLGVLVCIKCSGFHRRLGVHISKVRSLSLDNMEPEYILAFAAIGNEQANRVWQPTLPPDTVSPTNESDPYEWIERKYKKREFIGISGKTQDEHNQALQEASTRGDILHMLYHIAHGANVDTRSPPHNQTPLMHAVIHHILPAAGLLIAFSCNLDVGDSTNKTALHYAVEQNLQDMVLILLRAGASPNVVDSNGETPLKTAMRLELASPLTTLRMFSLAKSEETRDVTTSFEDQFHALEIITPQQLDADMRQAAANASLLQLPDASVAQPATPIEAAIPDAPDTIIGSPPSSKTETLDIPPVSEEERKPRSNSSEPPHHHRHHKRHAVYEAVPSSTLTALCEKPSRKGQKSPNKQSS
ncbi:centaurin beta [Pelomyxa schiedti]|nr:centaurin beta [Pelomyxa schiedti]